MSTRKKWELAMAVMRTVASLATTTLALWLAWHK